MGSTFDVFKTTIEINNLTGKRLKNYSPSVDLECSPRAKPRFHVSLRANLMVAGPPHFDFRLEPEATSQKKPGP